MSVPQPDFSKLFYETFPASAHPIRYRIRQNGNLLNDLVFMSSLTHDARILAPGMDRSGNALTIPLNRDCWELGDFGRPGAHELKIADAELRITGVANVRWSLPEPLEREPWLDCLWIDSGYRHEPLFDFSLIGEVWKCTVTLLEEEWSVELVDTELPYLWSERNPEG